MTEAEFLARIDGHIAIANQHMARGNELMGEVREEVRLNREERAESREFMRELLSRHEAVSRGLVEEVGAQTAVLRDLHDEAIAHRRSLWRVHDRLEDLRPEDLG